MDKIANALRTLAKELHPSSGLSPDSVEFIMEEVRPHYLAQQTNATSTSTP